MAEKFEISEEEIKKISGGTIDESARLALMLGLKGCGKFVKINPDRDDMVDIEALQEYFASKGYKFIPGFGGEQNVFIGPDGLPYGNDYIVYLIRNDQL